MDQFLSRFTFGLLMAQLFPGAVLLLSLTCPLRAYREPQVNSISELYIAVGNLWFGSTKSVVVFSFLAGGIGMFIHGLSWLVMAWLENHKGEAKITPMRDSFWHQYPFFLQILLAPIKMIVELCWILTAPDIEKLAMEESGAYILPGDKQIYDFFQDFYLYFAQFYAHLAYALLFGGFSLWWTWQIMGYTWRRVVILILAYFAASIFFLIARVQFTSLFKAENVLRKRADLAKLTPPVVDRSCHQSAAK